MTTKINFPKERGREREFQLTNTRFTAELIIAVLFFFACFLFVTKNAFAEGGAQFPVELLLRDETTDLHVPEWEHMADAKWNRLFVFAKPGERIVSTLSEPIVVYPSGDIIQLPAASENTIQVHGSNCSPEGCIFEFRLSSDALPTWDISVKGSSGIVKPGRMFSYGFAVFSYEMINCTLYILSDDGLIFQEKFQNVRPIWGFVVATKKGFVSTQGSNIGQSIYHSKEWGGTRFSHAYPKAQYISLFPNYQMDDLCHKIFFNYPDADLISYLGLPENPSPNVISNLSYDGNTNCSGGTISFETTLSQGRYQVTIDFGQASKNISFSGNINSTQTSVTWDGKDKNGDVVNQKVIMIRLKISSGEIHFINDDFEIMEFVITQMNGQNAGSDVVYYNNTETTIDGYFISAAGDGLDRSNTGVSSSSTVLFPDNTDMKAFDLWVLQPDDSDNIVISTLKDVEVKKTWQDDSNRDSIRPDSISFTLYCGSTECGNNPYIITEDDNWTITIPDIPIYDAEGHKYEYSVVENGL